MLLNKETVKQIPYDKLIELAGYLLDTDNYKGADIVDREIRRRDEARIRREQDDSANTSASS